MKKKIVREIFFLKKVELTTKIDTKIALVLCAVI